MLNILCLLKTLEWIFTEGTKYLEDTKLGKNHAESLELQRIHTQFEKQHNKVSRHAAKAFKIK